MNKNIKYLFAGSLLVNMLLAGIILGQVSGLLRPPPPPPPMPAEQQAALDKLPAERRDEFKAMMEKMQDRGSRQREDIRHEREETMRILKETAFDEIAYQQHIDRLNRLRGQRVQDMADAVKELARKWAPQERALLAELLRRPAPPPPPHGGPPPPPPGAF